MIAAFEGWNDAGEAASAVIEHLAEIWDAEVVAALDPEDYYDFQVNRPRVLLENGRRRISWRTTRVLVATNTPLGRDVVLVQGVEPPSAGAPSPSSSWSSPRPPTSRWSSRSARSWPMSRTPARSPSPRRPTWRTPATGTTSR